MSHDDALLLQEGDGRVFAYPLITAMVYHAYVGADRSARHMMLDAVTWDAATGWPTVAGTAPGAGGFLPRPPQ